MFKESALVVVQIPDAPAIAGLSFRRFRGSRDFDAMLGLITSSKDADGVERAISREEMEHQYNHLVNCDPYQDLLFAEIAGQAVAYSRVFWQSGESDKLYYFSFGFVHPAWRRKGIGRAMLHSNEDRLRRIAAGHLATHPAGEKFFKSFASQKEEGAHALLTSQGYAVTRHFFSMVRPDLEHIPELPLPPGLQVRLVELAQLPAINAASAEAFRDHWGYSPEDQPTVAQWLEDPKYDPTLWKVAWDGDQVAGMVLSFVDANENAEYNRLRGYTENICVRRPWRRQGLAKALIAQSLQELKQRGYQEAALGVDAENLSGALGLYESMGFQAVERNSNYIKPMEAH